MKPLKHNATSQSAAGVSRFSAVGRVAWGPGIFENRPSRRKFELQANHECEIAPGLHVALHLSRPTGPEKDPTCHA